MEFIRAHTFAPPQDQQQQQQSVDDNNFNFEEDSSSSDSITKPLFQEKKISNPLINSSDDKIKKSTQFDNPSSVSSIIDGLESTINNSFFAFFLIKKFFFFRYHVT